MTKNVVYVQDGPKIQANAILSHSVTLRLL